LFVELRSKSAAPQDTLRCSATPQEQMLLVQLCKEGNTTRNKLCVARKEEEEEGDGSVAPVAFFLFFFFVQRKKSQRRRRW
jgi:hypothetical protein